MQGAKETAANIGASAKAGLEKTKATVQEKTEKMTARDPLQKEMATQKKEAKINQAELDKQAAQQHNAAAKHSATYSTTGEYVQPMGTHQTSAVPGHGTGQPTGHVTEGVVGSHPIGTNTGGTGGAATAHNTRVGGNPNDYNYGTGGSYT